MVCDWIAGADEGALFGSAPKDLVAHKAELILVEDRVRGASGYFWSSSGSSSGSDTGITLIGVEGFDTGKAATYLTNYLRSKAQASGVKIVGITTSHLPDLSDYVDQFQTEMNSKMRDIQTRLNDMYTTATTVVEAPAAEETTGTTLPAPGFSYLLKFVLIGFFLGIVAGAALAIFLTLKQGRVISRRQIEESFNLELLSDCSKGGSAALEILTSNLDVMLGEDGAVMLLGSQPDEEIASAVSSWNQAGDRPFIAGRDIVDDAETIDALASVEGILMGLRIGGSRLSDIQRQLLRARKLGKQVLGYVLL